MSQTIDVRPNHVRWLQNRNKFMCLIVWYALIVTCINWLDLKLQTHELTSFRSSPFKTDYNWSMWMQLFDHFLIWMNFNWISSLFQSTWFEWSSNLMRKSRFGNGLKQLMRHAYKCRKKLIKHVIHNPPVNEGFLIIANQKN